MGVDAPLPKRPPGLLAELLAAPPKRPPDAGAVAPAPEPPNMPPVEGVPAGAAGLAPPKALPAVAGVVELPPNRPPPEAGGVLADAAPPKRPPAAGFAALFPSVFVALPALPKENLGGPPAPAPAPPNRPPEAGAVDVVLFAAPLDELGVPNVKDMADEVSRSVWRRIAKLVRKWSSLSYRRGMPLESYASMN